MSSDAIRYAIEALGARQTYKGAHYRVTKARGRAAEQSCVHCNRPAAHWALINATPNLPSGPTTRGIIARFSYNPEHYEPLCRHCHAIEDARKPTPAWFAGPCLCHTESGERTGQRYT